MAKNNQYPKVVIIGAGSLFFGRQAIWQMVHSQYLNNGILGLVDTDEERLEKLIKLAEMVVRSSGVKLKIEGSTDRKKVLKGADYVVLSFAKDTVKYRGIDCYVSLKYGIRMCSGDTIGPGGIFRAMRELPVIFDCAADIKSICPEAWVINYINPTAVHGIGLRRYFPELKSFALCDGLHMPHIKRLYAKRAGIIMKDEEYNYDIDSSFDLEISGVNHFTWILRAIYNGRDVLPEIAKSMERESAKETEGGDTGAKIFLNNTITYELYKIFGYIPACTGHTKEYLTFWQGLGISPDKIPPLSIWETEERYKRHDEMWKQIEDYIDGIKPIEQFMEETGPDHATDIIENMVGNLGGKFYINTSNNGAVPNMSDDSFLELLCNISNKGIKTLPCEEMPRGIRAMQEIVLDTHELTAEAVYEVSFEKLRRAMLIDPIVTSVADADNMLQVRGSHAPNL